MSIANPELWTDKKLLELMRDDDRSAFERIYNRYWSKLYLSAYNILRDRQMSEDLVQEIMIQLWLRRSELQIDSLQGFLHTAIRYQVFKALRSSKARNSFSEVIQRLSAYAECSDTLNEQDINRVLDDSIAKLPEKCREIFTLSRKEHLTTKEIALRLGIAPKTVENQLTIALRRLRVSLAGFLSAFIILLKLLAD